MQALANSHLHHHLAAVCNNPSRIARWSTDDAQNTVLQIRLDTNFQKPSAGPRDMQRATWKSRAHLRCRNFPRMLAIGLKLQHPTET
jgi:hypothetical protein